MGLNENRALRVVADPLRREWVSVSEGLASILESIPDVMTTSFVKVSPGGILTRDDRASDREIFILEGSITLSDRSWGPGSYLRLTAELESPLQASQEEGVHLFMKRGPFPEKQSRSLGMDTEKGRWTPGLVEGLSVLPLYSGGTSNTALVRWAPGTIFQPHRHFGGEEILVLSGVFEDEHGSYPLGTWIRSPHMSRHDPFSRSGCTIFVKTGHLMVESAA